MNDSEQGEKQARGGGVGGVGGYCQRFELP